MQALVIGAGLGGLAAAIELRRRGHEVTLLERSHDVGGVWRDNTYPGAACDVPSSLYSYSFAQNPRWSRRYAEQADILAYIRGVADRFGVRELVRTDTEVTGAAWDDPGERWSVHTATGEDFEGDVLVSAVGQLSRPAVPSLPGIDSFTGPAFHSAEWDHDVDLGGRRVAVVGTGASAIQFVPRLAESVLPGGAVTVFQRSAPYVVPKPDRTYTGVHHAAFERLPLTQLLGRGGVWLVGDLLNASLDSRRGIVPALRAAWRLHLRRQVRDPELRARLVPDYPIGCKRLLFSNDWYPTLTRPHVDVVTETVSEVLPHGLRTADGTEHAADVIVFGTGFKATEFLSPMRITGRDGRDLHEEWSGGARAHLGISVPGFPNLFCVYGPNTNLGGSSIIAMMEAQTGRIGQLVDAVEAGRLRSAEVRMDAADAFDAEMQARLRESVWSGCSSWYQEDSGRISTNWPGLVTEYRRRTADLDLAAYDVESA